MSSHSIRFAAYYGAFYFTLGAFLPYFPIWLEGRSLTPEWIGWISAAGLVGRTLISPLAARWADKSARRRDPVLIMAIAAVFLFALHAPTTSPWVLAGLSFLAGASFYGQIPLIDAFTMREDQNGLLVFGKVRAIGSALFIVSNFAAGALVSHAGSEVVLSWVIVGAMLVVISARLLPEGVRLGHASQEHASFLDLWKLVRGPFGLALLASALIQGAHGFYYVFSAVAWSAQGHSELVIGALWASGVVIEIIFLWMSGHGMMARLKPPVLLITGAVASVLRWGLLALSPPLWGLFLLQNLHALTFAATYLGFLRYATHMLPERYSATAQGINSALSGGVVMVVVSAVSGYLFSRVGAAGFAAMIVPSIMGMILALLLSRQSSFPNSEKMD